MWKSMHDSESNSTVTIVNNPLELIMAVNQSDPYIEVREHINLTGFYLPEGNSHVLGGVPAGVLGIRVLQILGSATEMTVPKSVAMCAGWSHCLFLYNNELRNLEICDRSFIRSFGFFFSRSILNF
jgi:hypothetical protein